MSLLWPCDFRHSPLLLCSHLSASYPFSLFQQHDFLAVPQMWRQVVTWCVLYCFFFARKTLLPDGHMASCLTSFTFSLSLLLCCLSKIYNPYLYLWHSLFLVPFFLQNSCYHLSFKVSPIYLFMFWDTVHTP